MVALEGMSEEPPHADKGVIWLQVPERDGAIMEAARRLARAGVGASDVVVRTPTLDDVFLSLTGHTAVEPESEPERELVEVAA
jgi:ABC-2 type transport system ATP-binding protein